MASTITPAASWHATIPVPENVTDTVDAAYMALNTWKFLADNAKYALDQIDLKITAMKADDALMFDGDLVTFNGDVLVIGELAVPQLAPVTEVQNLNGSLAFVGAGRKITDARTVDKTVTLSTWDDDPDEHIHLVSSGNNVRIISSVVVHLRLSSGGAVEGDWVRVTLSEGASVLVFNYMAETPIKTMTVEGSQFVFTFTTADGWVL